MNRWTTLWRKLTRQRDPVTKTVLSRSGFFQIPATTCPICKHNLNAAQLMDGRRPQGHTPGDLGVCYLCGGILEVGPDQVLTAISPLRWDTAPARTKAQLLAISQAAIGVPPSGKPTQDADMGLMEDE